MRYIICFLLLALFNISPLTNGAVVPSEGLYTGRLTLMCSDPGTPSYGYRKGYDFGIGSTVSFSCYEGFVLIGSNTLTCQTKEKRTSTVITWSDHTPVCVGKCVHCMQASIYINDALPHALLMQN